MEHQQQEQPASFDDVLAPIEEAAGEFLNGPGRAKCEAGYRREPEAFAYCLEKFLRKVRGGQANGIGLLPRIVRDELDDVARRIAAGASAKGVPCPDCGVDPKYGHAADCERSARAA